MIALRNFYRKLDNLVSKIGKEKTSKHYFASIVTELENTFGEDLRIANGRLYKESGDNYVLASAPAGKTKTANLATKLPTDSEPVRRLLKNGSYIYDDPAMSIDPHINMQGEYAIPAAFTVRTKTKRWIFVFELKSGWVREEVEFCLNAVRTALNYRLFSDSVTNEFEQAAQIQRSLLPATTPKIRGYQIVGRSQPADLVVSDLRLTLIRRGDVRHRHRRRQRPRFVGRDVGARRGDRPAHGFGERDENGAHHQKAESRSAPQHVLHALCDAFLC
jgi:hypothetical protein